jgi:hypothetical protein
MIEQAMPRTPSEMANAVISALLLGTPFLKK